MRAYIISDGEFQSMRHADLRSLVSTYLRENSLEIIEKQINRGELAFCRGCFDCWVKTPGECAIKDGITEINRTCMQSDVVVYLCPIVFGQFSANMKSVIDRWLPNMLPFFMTRKDGSTMHPPRYQDYPKQIFIGYGEDVSPEEAQLFQDITLNHRSNIAMILDHGSNAEVLSALNKVELSRIGGSL